MAWAIMETFFDEVFSVSKHDRMSSQLTHSILAPKQSQMMMDLDENMQRLEVFIVLIRSINGTSSKIWCDDIEIFIDYDR